MQILFGLAVLALVVGLWLLLPRLRLGQARSVVRLAGRVVGPGEVGGPVQAPAVGAPARVELEAGGRRYQVLLDGARLEGGRGLRVGEPLELEAVPSDLRREAALYREPGVETVLDALCVRRGPALRRRELGAALVGLALLLGAPLPLARLAARTPLHRLPAWLQRAVIGALAGAPRCPPGTRLERQAHEVGWSQRCLAAGGVAEGPAVELSGGRLARGAYRRGQRDGRWLEREAGASVVQSYREGQLEGVWLERDGTGRLRKQAAYRADQLDGQLLEWDAAGRLTRRAGYLRGAPHGRHETWREGRLVEAGEYRAGLREGRWLDEGCVAEPIWTATATRCEQELRAGQLDGAATWWFADGRRARGAYREGRATGRWTLWDAQGRVEREGELLLGFPHGRWSTFEAGRKVREERYLMGKRQDAITGSR